MSWLGGGGVVDMAGVGWGVLSWPGWMMQGQGGGILSWSWLGDGVGAGWGYPVLVMAGVPPPWTDKVKTLPSLVLCTRTVMKILDFPILPMETEIKERRNDNVGISLIWIQHFKITERHDMQYCISVWTLHIGLYPKLYEPRSDVNNEFAIFLSTQYTVIRKVMFSVVVWVSPRRGAPIPWCTGNLSHDAHPHLMPPSTSRQPRIWGIGKQGHYASQWKGAFFFSKFTNKCKRNGSRISKIQPLIQVTEYLKRIFLLLLRFVLISMLEKCVIFPIPFTIW